MQVAAMQRQVGRPVALLDRAAPGVVVSDLAGQRLAVERGGWCERDRAQPLLDAERAVYFHGVRALLDAGADPGEGLGLLVHRRVEPDPAQRRRHGEPADAGADDRDGRGLAHGASYRVAAIFSRKATRSSVTWSTWGS